jgi:hypothetical protein
VGTGKKQKTTIEQQSMHKSISTAMQVRRANKNMKNLKTGISIGKTVKIARENPSCKE